MKLLTPFQAENDYHLKDTYNYMTVQADIRLPKRHFAYLEDVARRTKYAARGESRGREAPRGRERPSAS